MTVKTFCRYLTIVLLAWAGVSVQAAEASLRVLALGDSYTIGEGVPVPQRWPLQLAERLRAGGVSVAEPEIIARTGWTTDDLHRAVTRADPEPDYDFVFLLIGVNDQYRGRSVEDYRRGFRQLLGEAISLARDRPGRVVVLSIPDYSVTPFAQGGNPAKIAQEIARYNAANKSVSSESGVHYVDIMPISKEARNDLSLLAADGLHPSGKMYGLWAEKALPAVLGVVK